MGFESIKTEKREEPVKPEIVLDEDRYAEGFPEGEPGEVREGYTFFAKVEKEDEVGWEHITSDIVDQPVLTAVTEEQKEGWSKRNMKAVPAKFIWSEEKGIWQVDSR